MWIEVICGVILYKVLRMFFGNDDVLDIETSDFNAIFSVATREAVVICVKNLAGFVSVNADGSWLCISEHKHKEEHHPNPVAEAKQQASILEAYLEQRGVSLPEGYLSSKVIISNPKFRLELKASKYVLGEFLEFKGKNEDIQELQYIKRSKVGQMIVQKTSMFGFAPTRLQVLYCFRDYRTEASSSSEWKEVTVRSSTEVVFQPQNAKKVRKFKLSAITSLTLSA
uniref:NERD domain-containing protein n=1 Tax=Chenopodium quinoa TaxID=63459 RepID=A0A803KSS6_CHEQI